MNIRGALSVSLVALGLAGTAGVFTLGCNGGTVAKVKAGPMPENEVWTGVYFNPAFGSLHIEESGDSVRGRWKQGQKFGEMTGTKDGNVVHFSWTEHDTVMVGASQDQTGKGYFLYLAPTEVRGPAKLKGEFGYKNDETGGGNWDCVKQTGIKADVDSIKADTPNAIPATHDTWDKDEGK